VSVGSIWRAVHRAHKILNRMRIPALGYNPDEYGVEVIDLLVTRLKTVQMYRDAIRGKWLREKKKSVAANRALEDWRRGNTKSWKQKAEGYERAAADAIKLFREKHAVRAHMSYNGGGPSTLTNLIEYLTDRGVFTPRDGS